MNKEEFNRLGLAGCIFDSTVQGISIFTRIINTYLEDNRLFLELRDDVLILIDDETKIEKVDIIGRYEWAYKIINYKGIEIGIVKKA